MASGIDVSIPKRDNSGNQSVGFAIDNVMGIAQQRINEAIDAGETITLVLRIYLDTDLSAPAERALSHACKGRRFRRRDCPGRGRILRPNQHCGLPADL
nr:DUF1833 family protein [Pseudomonas aeruginosa]